MGSCLSNESGFDRIVSEHAAAFEEACCISGEGRFGSLREYRAALFNWIWHMEDMGKYSRHVWTYLYEAVQRYLPNHHPMSAGCDHDQVVIGCSLDRFPSRAFMQKVRTNE